MQCNGICIQRHIIDIHQTISSEFVAYFEIHSSTRPESVLSPEMYAIPQMTNCEKSSSQAELPGVQQTSSLSSSQGRRKGRKS